MNTSSFLNLYHKFKNIIDNKRLSHLYLLEGGNFHDRKELVFKISYEILQRENKELHIEQLFSEHGSYPNFYYLNKNNLFITKENIIDLKNYFFQKPLIYHKRVYVIENVDKITNKAGNSLLNFLENPLNKETYGFLLTSNLYKAMPTIISRCQIFSLGFTKFKDQQVRYNFLQQKGFSCIDAFLITLVYKDQIELLDSFVQSDYYQNFKNVFVNIISCLEEKKNLQILFADSYLLNIKKGWFKDLFLCLMQFILINYYQKQNIDYFISDYDYLKTKLLNLSLHCLKNILDFLLNLEQKKQYLILDEELFIFLIIGLEDIVLKNNQKYFSKD